MRRLIPFFSVLMVTSLLTTSIYAQPEMNLKDTSVIHEETSPEEPTPDNPSPDNPSPENPNPESKELITERVTVNATTLKNEALEYGGSDLEGYKCADVLYIHWKDGSLDLEENKECKIININTLVVQKARVYHKTENGWVKYEATIPSDGKLQFTFQQQDKLGYVVVFVKNPEEFSIESVNKEYCVIDSDKKIIIIKNFNNWISNTSTQENYEILVEVKNATTSYSSERIGTGSSVTYTDTNGIIHVFMFVVLGDVNGDGMVTSADYIAIKNHIMEDKKITDNYQLLASDANMDDKKATSADYVAISKFIIGL